MADLGKIENISIKGHMVEGEILVPGADLDLEDVNGEAVILEDADRILPFSMYVPSRYHRYKTRLVVMLHGASSNENTTCDRLADRNVVLIRTPGQTRQ